MDHGGLMASVVLDEPSLGLSPVLVMEFFRCVGSIRGHCAQARDALTG
jgi:ABC-type branched-subunit amino acid transport system ATPase component